MAKCCNWCFQKNEMKKDKPYCVLCSKNCFKECSRCHRPFPDKKYFGDNMVRCLACQRKYLKERIKRGKNVEVS